MALLTEPNNVWSLLFDSQVKGQILPINDYTPSLYSEELALIKKVSNKRRLEFSTGRTCARQALSELGIEHYPILRNVQREPMWPTGIVGSISHCRDLCGAVVTTDEKYKSIGFDIENIKPLTYDITRLVCTKQELNWLSDNNADTRPALTILLFSLKEAIFKCVYPRTQLQIGFKDCTITPDIENNSAAVLFHRNDVGFMPELRFCLYTTHVFSSAYSA